MGRLEQQVVREWLGARLEGVERVRHRADAVADAGGELAREPHLDRLDEAADLVALPRRQLLGRRVVHGERDEHVVGAAARPRRGTSRAAAPRARRAGGRSGCAPSTAAPPPRQARRRTSCAAPVSPSLRTKRRVKGSRRRASSEQRERQVEDELSGHDRDHSAQKRSRTRPPAYSASAASQNMSAVSEARARSADREQKLPPADKMRAAGGAGELAALEISSENAPTGDESAARCSGRRSQE